MPLDTEQADRIRLMHMRDAAAQALAFGADRPESDLTTDDMFRRAVISCIQEIGEAAAYVSEARRAHWGDIPWNQIIAMRNRIVHVYFNLRPEVVWEVLSVDVKPLLESLHRIVGQG